MKMQSKSVLILKIEYISLLNASKKIHILQTLQKQNDLN